MTFKYDPSAFNFKFLGKMKSVRYKSILKFDSDKCKFVWVEVNKDQAVIIEGIVINFCEYKGEK